MSMQAPAHQRGALPLLRATNVRKYFPVTKGILFQRTIGQVQAVDDVSIDIYPGESVGLVGETGCGKSTLARVLMRLIDPTDGRILFSGTDITRMSRRKLRPLRKQMQIVFQDPYASLNPRKTVGMIISSPMRIHRTVPKDKIRGEVQQLMELVGLNPEHYNRYPHEFSGGQRQRIGVARALAVRPRFVVCDEPVSALDVSIQAQILNLLKDVQKELDLTYLFIAHDLSVVRHFCDRIAVMYLGQIVEFASRNELYGSPMHPYPQALLSAVPVPDPDKERSRRRIVLEGDVPSPIHPPPACRFHTRCWKAEDICRTETPALATRGGGASDHVTACHFAEASQVV